MDRIERLAELGRERTACVVAFPGAYDVSLVLKQDAPLERVSGLGKTPAVRALDVARIEVLVVQYILGADTATDRKSTRLNSSHGYISYAVFCLKKKKKNNHGLPSLA